MYKCHKSLIELAYVDILALAEIMHPLCNMKIKYQVTNKRHLYLSSCIPANAQESQGLGQDLNLDSATFSSP